MNLAVPAHSFERFPEPRADCSSLFFEGSIEEGHNIYLVRGQVTDPAQVLDRFLAIIFRQEPPWTFFHPEGAQEQETSGDQLDSKWDEPLRVGGRQGLIDAIIDPALALATY